MRIGVLASQLGISTDTLRTYERRGLLTPARRTQSGYREFPPGALDEVKRIRRALAVGFTMAELARFFRQRRDGAAPCRSVREAAAAKLAAVRRDRKELAAIERELRRLLAEWDRVLAAEQSNRPLRLLESLAGGPSAQPAPVRPRLPRHRIEARTPRKERKRP